MWLALFFIVLLAAIIHYWVITLAFVALWLLYRGVRRFYADAVAHQGRREAEYDALRRRADESMRGPDASTMNDEVPLFRVPPPEKPSL